jgi:tetrahydromethanopterin S-methyltransferase subunit G
MLAMFLFWIFGAGGQYRDFQNVADRVKALETRLELEQAKNDAAYARRDLYDLRLKNMDEKLDAIGSDVKQLKDGKK